MSLGPEEIELIGSWKSVNGRVTKDEPAQRIEVLVRRHLKPLAQSSSGWEKLFQDLSDGRFWELTYPASNLHGGRSPRLAVLTEDEARARYQF